MKVYTVTITVACEGDEQLHQLMDKITDRYDEVQTYDVTEVEDVNETGDQPTVA